MDLHQNGIGATSSESITTTTTGSYSQSTPPPPQHHIQQHQQLYTLLPASYSSGATLPPISSNSTTTHSQYLDRNNEDIGSLSWPPSRDLQLPHHHHQQSDIKRETMSKTADSANPPSNMPSTSDFVKKLYKFVPEYRFVSSLHSFSL